MSLLITIRTIFFSKFNYFDHQWPNNNMYIFRQRFIFSTRIFMFLVYFLRLNWSVEFLIFIEKMINTLFKTWDNEQVLLVPVHVLNLSSFELMLVRGLSSQKATSTQRSKITLYLWPIYFWKYFRMSLNMEKRIVSQSN